MISLDLAQALRSAGLRWVPVSGDRFAIPDRDLDGQVFVVSEMTIEPADLPTGSIVRFNGTTEWALDSIAQTEVIWLPHEGQLRSLLGDRFISLETQPGGFAVLLRSDGGDRVVRYVDGDAERAYARALLAVLHHTVDGRS